MYKRQVSRGEFLVMAMRVLGMEPDAAVLTSGFADEAATAAWMRPYITAADVYKRQSLRRAEKVARHDVHRSAHQRAHLSRQAPARRRSHAAHHQVAAMAGLDDQRYFSKVFRRAAGCTPQQYAASISRKEVPSP